MTPRRSPWPPPLGPRDMGVRPSPPDHTHKQSLAPFVPLYVALALLTVAVGVLTFFVVQQQAYVEGRGEYRDREAARMEQMNEQRSRDTACRILDALPQSPVLDRPRAEFNCGPGLPPE